MDGTRTQRACGQQPKTTAQLRHLAEGGPPDVFKQQKQEAVNTDLKRKKERKNKKQVKNTLILLKMI